MRPQSLLACFLLALILTPLSNLLCWCFGTCAAWSRGGVHETPVPQLITALMGPNTQIVPGEPPLRPSFSVIQYCNTDYGTLLDGPKYPALSSEARVVAGLGRQHWAAQTGCWASGASGGARGCCSTNSSSDQAAIPKGPFEVRKTRFLKHWAQHSALAWAASASAQRRSRSAWV